MDWKGSFHGRYLLGQGMVKRLSPMFVPPMIHEISNIFMLFSGKDVFLWRESLVLLQSQLSQPFPQSPTFRTANVGVVKKQLYRQKSAYNLFRRKFESSDEEENKHESSILQLMCRFLGFIRKRTFWRRCVSNVRQMVDHVWVDPILRNTSKYQNAFDNLWVLSNFGWSGVTKKPKVSWETDWMENPREMPLTKQKWSKVAGRIP